MHFRHTQFQVPRTSRPDAETFDKIYLVKNVLLLRETYQIKLLALKAEETGKKLVLKVPKSCRFETALKTLIKNTSKTIRREDL